MLVQVKVRTLDDRIRILKSPIIKFNAIFVWYFLPETLKREEGLFRETR